MLADRCQSSDQRLDQRPGGLAVLHRGGRNQNGENQALTVHGDMALTPRPERAITGLPRTKVTGQEPLLRTARAGLIEHPVQQTAAVDPDRSPTLPLSGFGCRHQRFELVPFFISQVRWIMSWTRLQSSHL